MVIANVTICFYGAYLIVDQGIRVVVAPTIGHHRFPSGNSCKFSSFRWS